MDTSTYKDEPAGRDDPDELIDEVNGDPIASAAFQDTQRRLSFLSSLSTARGARTQAEVAATMHTQQSTVSALENGRVDPRLQTLQRYARAVGQRLEVALVSPHLPAFQHSTANELWALLQKALLPAIVTDLVMSSRSSETRRVRQLAEIVRLSPELVTPMLAALESRAWVRRQGPPTEATVEIIPQNVRVIGIDVQPNQITGIVSGIDCKDVLHKLSRHLDSTSGAAVVEEIERLTLDLQKASGDTDFAGVGVTLAGVMGARFGEVRFAPDLMTEQDQWESYPLEATLQERLQKSMASHIRVVVENDANAAAVREYMQHGDAFVLSVLLSPSGAGIGSGLANQGRIWHGAGDAAGEIGHLIVDPKSTAQCRAFDHHGCLEAVASVASTLKSLGLPAGPRLRTSLARADERLRQGDEGARSAFASAGEALGSVMAPIAASVNPTSIVVIAPEELADRSTWELAGAWQGGLQRALCRTLSKGEVEDRLRFRAHHDDIEGDVDWKDSMTGISGARAAGAVVARHFLDDPAHWVPYLV